MVQDRIFIKDDSDKGGLTVGQKIKINGRGNFWKVTKVLPIDHLGQRIYDVERQPSRAERRAKKGK